MDSPIRRLLTLGPGDALQVGVYDSSLLPERKHQFTEPPFHPVRLDIRRLLTVHTRCALVRATLRVGMRQNVVAADLVVQGVETESRLCLRFRV
jgi:hypothetical protein